MRLKIECDGSPQNFRVFDSATGEELDHEIEGATWMISGDRPEGLLILAIRGVDVEVDGRVLAASPYAGLKYDEGPGRPNRRRPSLADANISEQIQGEEETVHAVPQRSQSHGGLFARLFGRGGS